MEVVNLVLNPVALSVRGQHIAPAIWVAVNIGESAVVLLRVFTFLNFLH
ncbi:hypothetical protein [Rodentibacter pneumotropicus]|nr:hypothetical protein [Rodentibacter pneumotropicus]